MRMVDQPVDIAAAARECDVAILNGTHASTAAVLLAGKPILQLPLFLEQQLIAQNVERLGAGLTASIKQPEGIQAKLRQLPAHTCLRSRSASLNGSADSVSFARGDQKSRVSAVGFRLGNPIYPIASHYVIEGVHLIDS